MFFMDKETKCTINKLIRKGKTNAEISAMCKCKAEEINQIRGVSHHSRLFYAGLFAAGAGALTFVLSREPATQAPKYLTPEPPKPVQSEIEVTFDEAYAQVSLRREHVRQSARRVGIDISRYVVEYDHDKSLTIDALFTAQSRNPRTQIFTDGTLKYLPPIIRTSEKIAGEEHTQDNLMRIVACFEDYMGNPPPKIFVYPSAYETVARTNGPQKKARQVVLESGLCHEHTHVLDYVNGLRLPGSDKPFSKDEVARLMHLGVYEALCEVHGFSDQIRFQLSMTGGCRGNDAVKYVEFYNKVRHVYAQRKDEFELMGLGSRLRVMFHILEADKFHKDLMNMVK